MGSASVVIYQPIASMLGHPQPGGLSLKVPVGNKPTALRKALKNLKPSGAALIEALEQGKAANMFVVVINGHVNHRRLDSPVHEGDIVSIFPVYVGG